MAPFQNKPHFYYNPVTPRSHELVKPFQGSTPKRKYLPDNARPGPAQLMEVRVRQKLVFIMKKRLF